MTAPVFVVDSSSPGDLPAGSTSWTAPEGRHAVSVKRRCGPVRTSSSPTGANSLGRAW